MHDINAPRPYFIEHPAMGTVYSLYLYAEFGSQVESWAEQAFAEVDRIEAWLSHYRLSSEISRINREAFGREVTTDPETFALLSTAFEWSARSNGAFDISVGKLMKAWGFVGGNGARPPDADLLAVRDSVGWEKVRLDRERRSIRFTSSGVELDPGGIGKGYAVDCVVRILRTLGVSAALLSAGGSSIYALGAPPGENGWKIRVPAADRQRVISSVTLRDCSLSTANLTEKHFTAEGKLYGSIMNPRTLHPVEGVTQVTVISSSATDSDVMSNVLFVLDAESRRALLANRYQESALVLCNAGEQCSCEVFRWPASIAEGAKCGSSASDTSTTPLRWDG
jgi:FAD:protein FMN transferase